MSRKFFLCLISALLLAAPFHFPFLLPLAWIAFVPLFWALEGAKLREAFLFGWATGVVANLGGFYWLPYTIRVFGGFPYGLSGFVFLIFAVLEGLQIALFSAFSRLSGFGPLLLFPALIWVALEFSFPHLFPWHLASSQANFLTLIQSADLIGPYGTSLLIVWLNLTLYAALRAPNKRPRAGRAAAAALGVAVLAALAYGHFRLSTVALKMEAAPKLALAAVQGNIDVQLKWDPAQLENNLAAYRKLTERVQGVNLVIWPETAVEGWLPDDSRRLPGEILPSLSPEVSDFIFGVRSFLGSPDRPDFQAFNSAFLADRQGTLLSRYHKQVLLAFGEYIPFVEILSLIPGVPALGSGFSRGDGPHALALTSGIRVAPLICYEDLMPALSRRFVREERADLLINLTNDAWYGRTTAPWQHARLALWRAIETRRSLVRVTNTGLTVVINARGEMVRTLPLFTPGVMKVQVDILEGETPYVRYGDWFAWTASLLSLVVLLRQALRKRSKSSMGSNRSNR